MARRTQACSMPETRLSTRVCAYFAYRNLGYDEATPGQVRRVNVIRAAWASIPTARGAHLHELDFQFVYVLKGWVEFEYEDVGFVRLEAGSMGMPPRIRHRGPATATTSRFFVASTPAEFVTREGSAAPQAAAE
ncbi:MAG: hypothetical protein U1E30_03165 [Rhodoblastus sp.]